MMHGFEKFPPPPRPPMRPFGVLAVILWIFTAMIVIVLVAMHA